MPTNYAWDIAFCKEFDDMVTRNLTQANGATWDYEILTKGATFLVDILKPSDYTNEKRQVALQAKKKLTTKCNWLVVHVFIPYYLKPDGRVIDYLFKHYCSTNIDTVKQGFDANQLLPSSFNKEGLNMLKNDLKLMRKSEATDVADEITESLEKILQGEKNANAN